MNDIIERNYISSYTIAALLHQWGVTPRVKDPSQIDFSFDGYEFSCVIDKEILLLHFGDVIFKDFGRDIVLSDVQAELGSVQKKIGQNFAGLSAFRTTKNEVGVEFITEVPIVTCLVIDHLHFHLNNFLSGSLKTLDILKNLGYRTVINYILSNNTAQPPSNKKTPTKHKQDLCFSCEGAGHYRNGVQCSICYGSGEHPEVTAQKKRKNTASKSIVKLASSCIDTNYSEPPYYYHDTTGHYAEDNAMQDDNLSEYSAEMGHDGDDY
ncbi:hypothetical protein [Aeromonas media]|uniref:hypothetical protein n=1 Tax=Aeromonas media TaxID=651 RepID=UPI003D03F90C